jgi:hypothetical protein
MRFFIYFLTTFFLERDKQRSALTFIFIKNFYQSCSFLLGLVVRLFQQLVEFFAILHLRLQFFCGDDLFDWAFLDASCALLVAISSL